MPRIELKQNSPEYKDEKDHASQSRLCDFDGCCLSGEHRAPKGRQSQDYYYFCLDHVRAYNAAWDYFDGMSPLQIQEEMLRSLYGDRPTWKHKGTEDPADILRRQAWQSYNFTEDDPDPDEAERKRRATAFAYHHSSPEYQAMALMGLEPPLDLDILKKRYKTLAKKHHPDRNKGCEKAEALLKDINIAYTVLKAAFEKYEKMIDKDNR